MGRWSYSSRNTVEECKSIDIFWLNRHGYLKGNMSKIMEWNRAQSGKSRVGITISIDEKNNSNSYIRLTYTYTDYQTGEKSNYDYRIPLISTACNFGGVRYWFICPLSVNGRPCNRKVAKLYLTPNEKYFGCRHCYNLTYKCQKEQNKRVNALLKNPALFDRLCDNVELLDVKILGHLLKASLRLQDRYMNLFESENIGRIL